MGRLARGFLRKGRSLRPSFSGLPSFVAEGSRAILDAATHPTLSARQPVSQRTLLSPRRPSLGRIIVAVDYQQRLQSGQGEPRRGGCDNCRFGDDAGDSAASRRSGVWLAWRPESSSLSERA